MRRTKCPMNITLSVQFMTLPINKTPAPLWSQGETGPRPKLLPPKLCPRERRHYTSCNNLVAPPVKEKDHGEKEEENNGEEENKGEEEDRRKDMDKIQTGSGQEAHEDEDNYSEYLDSDFIY